MLSDVHPHALHPVLPKLVGVAVAAACPYLLVGPGCRGAQGKALGRRMQ